MKSARFLWTLSLLLLAVVAAVLFFRESVQDNQTKFTPPPPEPSVEKRDQQPAAPPVFDPTQPYEEITSKWVAEARRRYAEDARTNHVTLDKPLYTNAPWSEVRLRASALEGDGLAASLCSGSNGLQVLFWLSLSATNGWIPSQVRLANDFDYERPKDRPEDLAFKPPLEDFNPELKEILKQPKAERQAASQFWLSQAKAGLPKLKEDAKENDARALYALGLLHQTGDLVESNSILAAKMFQKAAELGLPPAQDAWGKHCEWASTNHVEAAGWYYRAATQGLMKAQASLSILHREPSEWHFDSRFQPQASERARWAFARACQPIACFETYWACQEMGQLYINGLGIQSNAVEGVKWYHRAIAMGVSGYGSAEHDLALFYFGGDGVPQDDAEGLKWLTKAKEKGYEGDDSRETQLWEAQYAGNAFARGDYHTAIKYWRKNATLGDAQAQFNLGYCYAKGQGVAKDDVEAVKWYRKAAEQNLASAQCNLGNCYANGEGVAKDDVEAAKWYRKAAEQNFAEAQYNLGLCYYYGNGVTKDFVEAYHWFSIAMSQGVTAAGKFQSELQKSMTPEQLETARKIYIERWVFASVKAKAEKGDANSQYLLAYYYEEGEGVSKDAAEAMKWFRKAAENGYAPAQFNLGYCYAKGQGVPKDDVEAAKWYRKAAEQNLARAQCNLGNCYANGEGVAKDDVEAVKWYRKAAEQNFAEAQYNLGLCYSKGEGVPIDYPESAKWYRKAAEQGHAGAQCNLGVSYYNGKGVPKDYVEAYKWFNLAAAQGAEDAKGNLSSLEQWMSSNQIAEAQRLSREFKPRKAPEPGISLSPEGIVDSSPATSGTGFFISGDGFLVSNAHVVEGAPQIRLVTSAGFVSAKVVKVDAANDLALLKAEGKSSPLPLAASRGVKLGSTVATVGFPNIGLQGFAPKLAKGEIASLSGPQDDARYFQISVPVQPGNSGGALVDERGNVVGVVSAKLSARAALAASGSLPENVNYAIKSSYLLSFLESVPEVSAKLKEPETKERKFEDVVKSAEQAAVLVLVY